MNDNTISSSMLLKSALIQMDQCVFFMYFPECNISHIPDKFLDMIKKEIIVVLVITLFILGLIIGYGLAIIWAFRILQMHILFKVFIIAGITALAGTMIYVAVERIREIREEEKDDLSQY